MKNGEEQVTQHEVADNDLTEHEKQIAEIINNAKEITVIHKNLGDTIPWMFEPDDEILLINTNFKIRTNIIHS